jgi:hypothetical protein
LDEVDIREELKIDTDLLRGLVEENKQLLRKAFALVRALELVDLEFERTWEPILRSWSYPRLAYQAVAAS